MNSDDGLRRLGAGGLGSPDPEILMEEPKQSIPQRYRSILGPLSLFTQNKHNKGKVEVQCHITPELERQRIAPSALLELCKLVQCRIQAQAVFCSASHEDQQALVEALMLELGHIWHDLNALSSDPTLSQEENQQLYHQIFGEVIQLSVEIYLHSLQLLDTLRKRAAFSNQANLIRVRAQMAMACSRHLSIHVIKQNLTHKIKAMRGNSHRESKEQESPEMLYTPGRINSSPQSNSSGIKSGHQRDTIENDLQEITDRIEALDSKLICYLVSFPSDITNMKVTQCAAVNTHSDAGERDDITTSPRHKRMQGCCSVPELHQHMLLKELQLERLASRPQTPLVLPAAAPSPKPTEPVDVAEDLRRLIADRNPSEKMKLEEPKADLPPLIKAVIHHSSSKLQLHPSVMEELLPRQQETKTVTGQKASKEESEQPQVAVVNVMPLPNSIYRTIASKVSDWVHTGSINTEIYPPKPVGNDLIEEIESSSEQRLDRNVFAREGITEAHQELSKTISRKHLNLNDDPKFKPARNDTSFKRKRPCVINSKLKRPNLDNMTQRRRTKTKMYHERPMDITSSENKELNYLGAVIHLQGNNDDEDKNRLRLQEEETKKQKEKVEALKSKKHEFVTGLWNVNSVMLGGLGKDPKLEDDDSSHDTTLTSSKQKKWRQGVVSELEMCSHPIEESEEDSLQMRLEKIWSVLCFPDGMRQDMALKYSSSAHLDQLELAIEEWEHTAQLIQQREASLAELEQFERDNSDPNRFFQQGYGGSSMARMDESKRRERLNSQITGLDKVLHKSLREIKDRFNDTVTYRGRPYGEKMRWDRIEMLFWLQQERREKAVERMVKSAGAFPVRLIPLELHQLNL
ncbi:hypothetical protein GJAV_G00161060 [Gymnothorax javanicus]|nr:hypothetical protein GJAV_G00161060 [Gymnothorax javanicus]